MPVIGPTTHKYWIATDIILAHIVEATERGHYQLAIPIRLA